MKLIWFEIEGYKRYKDPSKMNLDGNLIAIVGPNEAGKTSLLKAIQHLNSDTEYIRVGGMQELTRGASIKNEDAISEWTFFLDESDHEALEGIPEAKDARWYTTRKKANAKWEIEISPVPKRCMDMRSESCALARLIMNNVDVGELAQNFVNLTAILESEDDTLSSIQLKEVRELAEEIKGSEMKDVDILVTKLNELCGYEELPAPSKRAEELLNKREPRILIFDDEDRDLKSEYDLNSFFLKEDPQRGIKRASIPPALANLADAANLDLEKLHRAASNSDRGLVRTLLENASKRVTGLLGENWTQSNLSLNLDLDRWLLQVLLKSGNGEYERVVERSDGLRQFLALLVFMTREHAEHSKPIILIDEVERHLHYDAQADMVQMLAAQKLASKVIYTTHSVGCLPEDLGSGVRIVSISNSYSSIENWFWNTSRPGFSPLLFGMGARTLAFLPMRYAIIAEGAADMILIPALLKEGLGIDTLGYQIAPGLSSSSLAEIGILDNESSRTAYLCDSDSAGGKIRAKLLEAKINDKRIVTLPEIEGKETVIEDYLLVGSYLYSVNIELVRSGCKKQIVESDLDCNNRPGSLEKWCKKNGVGCPSKRAVAYHIVENRFEHRISDPCMVEKLRELDREIRRSLGIST